MSEKPRLVYVTDPAEIEAIKASWTGAIDTITGGILGDRWVAQEESVKAWRARRAAETVKASLT